MTQANENAGSLPEQRALEMWVVYERPSDYPNHFIARRWDVLKQAEPTQHVIKAESLEHVREVMIDMGLVCMMRQPEDEPQIVEVWF